MLQTKGNKSAQSVSPSVSIQGKSVVYTNTEKIRKQGTIEKTVTTDLSRIVPQNNEILKTWGRNLVERRQIP